MPRKLERLLKLSEEKNLFIVDRLSAFETLINKAGALLFKKLAEKFLDQLSAEEGALLSAEENLRKVSLIDVTWKKFQQREGLQIITTFVRDLKEIMDLGEGYYTELIPSQVVSQTVTDIINQKLGLSWEGGEWTPKAGGYIDALFKDRTILTDIKKTAYNNIMAATGPTALRKEIENYLVTKGEEPSKFYRFYSTFTFDTYSQVDRLNSKLHADRLELKYFLFNGGTVKDSRQFCLDHHDKCYSEEEAEGWRKLIGKFKMVPGKRVKEIKVPIGPIVEDKDTYDPVRDMGGIRCRHSADYVSAEIAEALRKKNPPTIP